MHQNIFYEVAKDFSPVADTQSKTVTEQQRQQQTKDNIMPKHTRIGIPSADGEIIGLAAKIKDKHTADGAQSPITGLDWAHFAPKIDLAENINGQINSLTTQVEQLVQQRNGLASELGGFVRSSRDVLQGLNRPALRKLMDWGFSVDDTPKQSRKTVTTVADKK